MSLLENPLGQEPSVSSESNAITKDMLLKSVLALNPEFDTSGKYTSFDLVKEYRRCLYISDSVSDKIQVALPAFHYCANLDDYSFSKYSKWINDPEVAVESIEEGERAFLFVGDPGRATLLKRYRKVSLQLAWEEDTIFLPSPKGMRLVLDVMYNAHSNKVCILDVVGTLDNPAAFIGMPWIDRQAILERLVLPEKWDRLFYRPLQWNVIDLETVKVECERAGKQGFILKNFTGKYNISNTRGGINKPDTWFRYKFGKEEAKQVEPVVYDKAFIRGMLRDAYGRVWGVELAVLDGARWKTIGAAVNVSRRLCLEWENNKESFEFKYLKAVCKIRRLEDGAFAIESLTGSRDITDTALK